jgi:hypothetical protein
MNKRRRKKARKLEEKQNQGYDFFIVDGYVCLSKDGVLVYVGEKP